MDIVILTPIKVEYQAVRKHLTNLTSLTIDNCNYEIGKFKGKSQEFKIGIRRTGSGNATIALATEKAIQHYKPSILLLVGVAGGVKDVQLYDVVVATKAYGYASGKETESGYVARPNVYPLSKELLAIAERVEQRGDWIRRLDSGILMPIVYQGPIASDDKVIASRASNSYKTLKKFFNDTLAIEMEAIGFAEAVSAHSSIKALNIRSISDLIENKKASESLGSQEDAAAVAAAFAFELIYQLDLIQLKPSKPKDSNHSTKEKRRQKWFSPSKILIALLVTSFFGIVLYNFEKCNFHDYPQTFNSAKEDVEKDTIQKSNLVDTSSLNNPAKVIPPSKIVVPKKSKVYQKQVCFIVLDKDNNKSPIAEARISIRETGFSSQTTNREGQSCFTNVPLKKIKVMVRKDSLFKTYEGEFNILGEQAENAFEILLEKSPSRLLIFHGLIKDEKEDTAISNAAVVLHIGPISKETNSDTNGKYKIELPNNTNFTNYTLIVDHEHFKTTELKRTMSRNNWLDNSIYLKSKQETSTIPPSSTTRNNKQITVPLIIIVKDNKEQSMVNKVDVLINETRVGKAGRTFNVSLGENNIKLQWDDKIYEDVLDIQEGKLIRKLIVSIGDFH